MGQDTDTDTILSPPIQCHDNLAIISLYLETPSAAIEPEPLVPAFGENEEENENTALSLLLPEFSTFYSTIPTLSRHISTQLSNSIADLRSLTTDDPSNEPASSRSTSTSTSTSTTHHARIRARDKRLRTSMAPVKLLSTHLAEQVAYLRRRQLFELPTARRAMAATAAQLLAAQAVVLERIVVILERGMHGALARRIKARADHLGTVARGVEGKVEYVFHFPCPISLGFYSYRIL
jgi:diphthamide biosynthesis protein 3